MVCVPCLVVPALLFIWYRFLQPIFLKIWNPFGTVENKKTDAPKDEIANGQTPTENSNAAACPGSGKTNGTCPISAFSAKSDKKID